jgi:hypothetical protein
MDGYMKKNPYNISYFENWKSIFGTKPFFWFIPTRMYVLGDGLHYNTIPNPERIKTFDSDDSDDEKEISLKEE